MAHVLSSSVRKDHSGADPICVLEQVVGVEPTSSAWKAEVIAIIRYLHIATEVASFEGRCITKYTNLSFQTLTKFASNTWRL